MWVQIHNLLVEESLGLPAKFPMEYFSRFCSCLWVMKMWSFWKEVDINLIFSNWASYHDRPHTDHGASPGHLYRSLWLGMKDYCHPDHHNHEHPEHCLTKSWCAGEPWTDRGDARIPIVKTTGPEDGEIFVIWYPWANEGQKRKFTVIYCRGYKESEIECRWSQMWLLLTLFSATYSLPHFLWGPWLDPS